MLRTRLSTPYCAALAILTLAGCNPSSPAETKSVQPAPAAQTTTPASGPASEPPPATAKSWDPGPAPEVQVSLAPLPTQRGDVPESHDIAFLKRFQGAAIIGYISRPYYGLTFYSSTGDSDNSGARLLVEGQTTRLVYRIPPGHGALEVFRNYENLASASGLKQASERPCGSDHLGRGAYAQMPIGQLSDPFGASATMESPSCYFTARGTLDGRVIMIGVAVAEKHQVLDRTGVDGKPLTFKDGEVVALVDLIATKPAANQMVTVKAADMADALASKGVVDLYGILFDTDKTEVKPDSAAALAEVASLLKIDRSLKLEVSGHTDNAGSADHNLKLSQGRAEAVVAALVGQYGIDAKRLVAKGYGSAKPVAGNDTAVNMSKNRRVELRKIG